MVTKKVYHITLSIEEDNYKKLQQISKLLLSDKLERISIQVDPENLIPEYLQMEMLNFLIDCLKVLPANEIIQ